MPAGNMETWGRRWSRGHVRIHWLLVVALCWWVKSVNPARLPACPTGTKSGNAACTCNNNNDGLQLTCNGRNPALTLVPSSIPENTSVLNLQDNDITRVLKGDFIRLESMRTLFLQENKISFIEPGAFDNLYNLELLVLSNNRLTLISDSLFQHLPSIKSIDLTNNLIVRIDKRAFLTLPASRQSSTVNIKLSTNRINCDCDSLALREWRDSLDRRLAQINFEGFQCNNAQGVELDGMRDTDFPACTSSQLSVFDKGQNCVSCRSRRTQYTCDVSSISACSSSQPTCQSQVQMVNGKLVVSKQCGSYRDCLLRERDNYRQCNVSHSGPVTSMQCTFCCTGIGCNQGDLGGRTSSYQLYVGLRLRVAFQTFMLDPTDPSYIQQASIYEQKLAEMFQLANGGYDVRFLSFRKESPYTYVTLQVQTTNLNTFSVSSVVILLTERLNISARQDFLKQQGAVYIYVGTELATIKRCMREVTRTDGGTITWQEAAAGSTSSYACPSGTQGAYATRRCVRDASGVAQWEAPNLDACKSQSPNDTTQRLKELNNTRINNNNRREVLNQLKQLCADGSQLTVSDVNLAMDTVDRSLALPDSMDDLAALDSTVTVLSNLIGADTEVLQEANRMSRAASRLVAAADRISAEGLLSSTGTLMLSGANLVVAARAVDRDSFQGLTLTAAASNQGTFQIGDVMVQPNTDAPRENGSSLVLPPSLITTAPGSRIAMTVQATDKVFEAIRRSRRTETGESGDGNFVTKVNSYVMAASVVGQDVIDLKDPVTFTLVHDNENSTNPRCVFWDVALPEWSSRGCRQVAALSANNVTTCQCDHLTNFALLMDVYGRGVSLSATDSKILSIISYIGCGVSLLALLLTLLTYGLFKKVLEGWYIQHRVIRLERKLRRDNPSKILVNLCVALAVSNLVFVAGMHPYALNNVVGCKIVAVLLHFSLLSSLCWMAVEAFYMYMALVLVFKTYFTNFILKCSLVGWGVPFVVVIITLSINKTDNYGALNTGMCWLKELSFYGAFVAPVCLILIINFLAFALVLRQILGMSERKLNKSDSFTVTQQLRGATGVAILLGLTWIFAVFAIDQASVVFYYLFAIFNSLQGLWIFLFYCVLKKEARNAWLRALPCCHVLDEKSGMGTTSKAGYSGTSATQHGVNRSLDTSVTGNTSSTVAGASKSSHTDSEVPYVNGGMVTKNDPTYENVDSSVVHPSNVAITLSSSDVDKKGPEPASRPPLGHVTTTVTAYRSEGKVTITATESRPIEFHTGQTLTETKEPVRDEQPQSPRRVERSASPAGTEEPRPIHFKLGHAYSLEPSGDKGGDESREDDGAATDDNGRMSVADMIKKLNTRL